MRWHGSVCLSTPWGRYPHPFWQGVPLCFLMGVPHLSIPGQDRGVPPSQVKMGGSPIPGQDGGTPIPGQNAAGYPNTRSEWGVSPSQVRMGVPIPIQVRSQVGMGGGTPNRNTTACTFYSAGGMPLAFTQEDFLVICAHTILHKCHHHLVWYKPALLTNRFTVNLRKRHGTWRGTLHVPLTGQTALYTVSYWFRLVSDWRFNWVTDLEFSLRVPLW